MDSRQTNLKYLFHPASIAFVGATESMGKWGFIIFNNLLRGGWKGRLYPVNKSRESILGIKAYPSVTDIPDEVDLAVFTVPAKQVLSSLDECIRKGVKAGLVISAGFKETGGDNVRLEAELAAKARKGNMILAGPNGQGICVPPEKLFPWMPDFFVRSGSVAVASQSGNIMSVMIGGVTAAGLGIAEGVSSGNEADMTMGDYIQYFGSNPGVEVILSYMEGLTDGTRFIEQVKDVTPEKPVVILKGGRTAYGKSAASSHTGSMAVSSSLFSAMCRQNGIIEARTLEESGFLAASFVGRPLPRGNRTAIITGGGGLGVIASDKCHEEGLDIVKLSAETLKKLAAILPEWWVPGNPVDMVAGMDITAIYQSLDILIKCGEIDSILLTFVIPPQTNWDAVPEGTEGIEPVDLKEMFTQNVHIIMEQFYNMSHEYNIPIFPVMNICDKEGINVAERQGVKRIAISRDIEMTCRAIGEMYRYNEYRKKTRKS